MRPSVGILAFCFAAALPLLARAVMSAPQTASDAPRWTKMPLLSPEQKKAGIFPGGEGAQWPRDLVISRADPNFLILAIDVGGLYRTRDGGRNWERCDIGWSARGANAIAIHPKDPNRVLGVAGNSGDWKAEWGKPPHGVYLSTDKAASWKPVLPRLEGHGGAVAWDTRDANTAYYLPRDGGLFRSTDGGMTWTEINNTVGDARLAVQEGTGAIFLAGHGKKTVGLWRSADGGKTFTPLVTEPVWGLSLHKDAVYISGRGGVRKSSDGGKTFAALPNAGLDLQNDKPAENITVSPADPRYMACWVQGDNWKWVRCYSTDGGATWKPSRWDNAQAVLPQNVRQGMWAYHPTDAKVVYTLGGDWVTRSDDGGATFRWFANGYNGVMLGGLFNFSPTSPNTVMLGFQDYNGAFTTDGGATWNYRDVSGKGWGGYCYGGYTPDGQTLWSGDAPGWGGKRTLRISYNGGKTWAEAKSADGGPVVFAGPDVGYSDPNDPTVCFASNWRSADGGKTWRAMQGCDAVFIASPAAPRELIGKAGDAIVVSEDRGVTWRKVADVPGGNIRDVAYDHRRKRFYVASQDQLKAYEGGAWTVLETPKDQFGNRRVRTVAVDPVNPDVVYAGGSADIYATFATLCRSTDAGKTWKNLTVTAPLGRGVTNGPREVNAVRVHPRTREAWVNGQCYGMWRIAAPDNAAQ
jgi:photosystem II stability/assembly factor-like uncharacterized protein